MRVRLTYIFVTNVIYDNNYYEIIDNLFNYSNCYIYIRNAGKYIKLYGGLL